MRPPLKIVIPLAVLVALAGVWKFGVGQPHAKPAKPKVAGEIYVLPKEFLVNLSDDRFAKMNIALVLEGEGQIAEAGHGASPPPEGFGPLTQEAVVRDIITDEITDAPAEQLIDRQGRHDLKRRVTAAIERSTDVKVDDVLFTDVAVQ